MYVEASPRIIVRLCDLGRKPGVTGYQNCDFSGGFGMLVRGEFSCWVMDLLLAKIVMSYTIQKSLNVQILTWYNSSLAL